MEATKQTQSLLKNFVVFQECLEHYKPSQSSIQTLKSVPLVLLVGPTAAGRNTLIDLLRHTGRYFYIVSDTTRARRTNDGVLEQDGVEYWFKAEQEVLDGVRNGEYIEAAVIHGQQVSGVHVVRLEKAKKTGLICLKEVEVKGAATYYSYKPDTLNIFLLPPTFEVWMKRLKARGDMGNDELRRRIESAMREIYEALQKKYYQFVINNEIHEAAQAVDEIANGRAIDEAKQQTGRDHAEQLLIDVQLYLQS